MAQSGEARTEPANARVGTIQIWIEAIAFGCMALGFGALLAIDYVSGGLPFEGPHILEVMSVLFAALGVMSITTARGLILLARPGDVRGALRSEAEHIGNPHLYGLALTWAGVWLATTMFILDFYHVQVWVDWVALFGLSVLPVVILRMRARWRHGTGQTP